MATIRRHLWRFSVVGSVVFVLGASAVVAQPLTSGDLTIAGANLEVAPAFQEIDPGRMTVVETWLSGVARGQAGPGLRVRGELSGPGLQEPLQLSTVPGEPFHIPGLNREGTYSLSGIRLTDGDEPLLEATPSSVEILVHRLVIASVTSRPLTPEEIESYGIVITEDNYTAWHYTVAYQVEGNDIEIPFDILSGPDGLTPLEMPDPYYMPLPNVGTEGPVPAIQFSGLEPIVGSETETTQPSTEGGPPVVPGFLIFPTDVAFLNQFFSVIAVVQNGALADSGIELRDVTASLELSGSGIRQAETEPPTIPGEAVPVMDPGPDGEVGTSDDLTIIVAHASGEASWLVEGLEEGQHRVTAHLRGELHGLAGGEVAYVEGVIPGVVLVRDPRFSMTFFHPWTVRAGEQYSLKVIVANTSTTPVYDLTLNLPGTSLTGAQLLVDPAQGIQELLPGQSAMVSWDLRALTTGRVVASAFNTSNPIEASFRFEMGVGELGIPLSPESLVLPPIVDLLPPPFVETALETLGLAYSLATAPNGAEIDLPAVGEGIVRIRAVELATAARRFAYGENLQRAMMTIGLRWLGSDRWSVGWDALRRASRRGHQLDAYLGSAIADRITEVGPAEAIADLEEIAITGRTTMIVLAEGAGYEGSGRLAVVGSTTGFAVVGQGADTALFRRELPGATVVEVEASDGSWSGEVGIVAIDVDEELIWIENGYQVQVRGTGAGSVDLEIVLVLPDGSTRRVAPSGEVPVASGSFSFCDVWADQDEATLYVDSTGDGVQDNWEVMSFSTAAAPAPRLLSATLDSALNPPHSGPYDDLVLLFSQTTDSDAVASIDPSEWTIPSHLELSEGDGNVFVSDRERHGGVFSSQADPAFLVLSSSGPLNPNAELRLSTGAAGVPFRSGQLLDLTNHAIAAGDGMPSGAVRGILVGSDGNPVPGARVNLYENVKLCQGFGCRWVLGLSDHVVADSNGSFEFDAVRSRNGLIPARYAPFLIQAIDPVGGHEAAIRASLAGNGVVRDLTVFMVGRGDVVGTIVREDGDPLNTPIVYGRSVTNPEDFDAATPDASGSFRLTDLPIGAVQILAVDGPDFVYGTAMVPGPGQEGSVDLVLPTNQGPMAKVTGTVTDADAAQVMAGVQVFVLPAGSDGATHLAATDSVGAFSIDGVPPGITTFKVWDPQRSVWVATHVQELVGDADNTVAIVASASSTGSIVGTVYELASGVRSPVAGAYLLVDSHGRWAITSAAGSYRLDDLTIGTVSLKVTDPASGLSTRRSVDLTAEDQVLIVDFDLVPGGGSGAVQVLVTDRGGAPVAGAGVAVERFGSGHEATTGADGTAVIEGLAKGKHEIITRLGRRLGRGEAIVRFDGHIADCQLTLGGTVSVSVETVADTTGGGSERVVATMSFRHPGIGTDGRIRMLPENGEHSCETDADLLCHIEDIPEGVGTLVVTARNAFYGETSLSESLDPSDDGEILSLNFSAPGSISGRILSPVDDQLEPVSGAIVEILVEHDLFGLIPQGRITTEDDGAFTFDLIPHGLFSLRAYSPALGGVARLDGRILSAQHIDTIELVVRSPGSVDGEISICFGDGGAGENVNLTLEQSGFPRPFISDLTIPELATRQLELTLDAAGSADFLFTGLAIGKWNLRATSAVNGSARQTVEINEAGEVLHLVDPVCLHPTGSVSGHVIFPETGAAAGSVQVQMFQNPNGPWELLTAEITGEDGFFSFADLPVGRSYLCRAYDASSNRGGASGEVLLCSSNDPGHGATCFQHAQADIGLAGLGTVEGLVMLDDGSPIANAFVRLQTSVVVNSLGEVVQVDRELLTFSGSGGHYSFAGVSEGTARLTAYDPDSALFVAETAALDPVQDPITVVDLRLPATEEVTVRVLEPGGAVVDGIEPVVAFTQSSSSSFREPHGGGRTVTHLSQGQPAVFDGVVAGQFKSAACVGECSSLSAGDILGQHFIEQLGGSVVASMSNPPEEQAVDVWLVGRSEVGIIVMQEGEPVAGADVRLEGHGHYGALQVVTQTGADGAIDSIVNVGVGNYTAAATINDGIGNTLRGSTTFSIDQAHHGGLRSIVVQLEEAGAADGVILDPDGDPAEGALVTLTGSGRVFRCVSAADGAFLFPALPVTTGYRLEVYAAEGAGRYIRHHITITTDVNHLGELKLDDRNPTVAGTLPANGQQHVDENTTTVVDFSEQMRHESLTEDRVRLREYSGGSLVATTMQLEDIATGDGMATRLILDPGVLAGDTLYVIDVLQGIEDLGGRTLAYDAHFTFRTRDNAPPYVVGAQPTHDPSGQSPAGPDVEPLISFSEPLDQASVTGSSVRLVEVGGATVVCQLVIERDGFDVRLRPATALLLDTFYTVEVVGVSDSSGNQMTTPVVKTFRVRDAEPPLVLLLPPDGATVDGDSWWAVEGAEVVLRAGVSSNDAVAALSFAIDSVDIGQGAFDVGTGSYALPGTVPLEAGELVLSAQAIDVSGNLSVIAVHTLEVVDDLPPTGVLTVVPDGEILPNHELVVSVDASDDHGLATAVLTVTGAVETSQTLVIGGLSDQVSAVFRLPRTAPTGGQIIVACVLEDSLGQSTSMPPHALTVSADLYEPTLVVQEPGPGAEFTSGDTIQFDIDLSDEVAVVSAVLIFGGEDVPLEFTDVQLPGSLWSATASGSVIAPETELQQDLAWTLTATDPAGNESILTDHVSVRPRINPDAPVISFVCPMDGDFCAPGVEHAVSFEMSDPNDGDLIQSYTVTVNDVPLVENVPVDQSALSSSFSWTPPTGAQAGERFELAIEARDYAGNVGRATLSEIVAGGVVLVGTQVIDSSYDGLDLVLAGGTMTASVGQLYPASLTILKGTTVIGHAGYKVRFAAPGAIHVQCGAAIDVTGLGYAVNSTYPGETLPTNGSAGSHVGRGGSENWSVGTTFGSVTRPQEAGGGSYHYFGTWGSPGGGVVRLEASSLRVDGAIHADGEGITRGGAGGSVWATVDGEVSGDGTITACGAGSIGGGGGAIAIEYVSASGSLLQNLSAASTVSSNAGGAGTIFTFQPGVSMLGDLLIEGAAAGKGTPLPSLGSGEALVGSGYSVLVTDRTSIQPYFLGHWVEISGPDGVVEGFGRIGAIDGGTITFEAAPSVPLVEAGDSWRGVYRFDRVDMRGINMVWGDAILASIEVVDGTLVAFRVDADNLVLEPGSVLTHSVGGSLKLTVADTVTIPVGATIDVTGKGYAVNRTYPGETLSTNGSAGSHLGRGSFSTPSSGSTYGSVTRPREAGAGSYEYLGTWGGPGGGVVRIEAGSIVLEGAIHADGEGYSRGGAGGSVWLTVDGAITGDGQVTARGAGSLGGGGGAIAVEYGSVFGQVLGNLKATGGGSGSTVGGAGTVYLVEAGNAMYGDLVVDNDGFAGRATLLPGLGNGAAQAGSAGNVLVTDMVSMQPYFIGHWVELSDESGAPRGVWRIAGVEGGTIVLETNGVDPDIIEGDLWSGLYRFDSVAEVNGAVLQHNDPIEAPGWGPKRTNQPAATGAGGTR